MNKNYKLAFYGTAVTLVIILAWGGVTLQKINYYEQEVISDRLELMKSEIKQMELDISNEQLKDRVITLPRVDKNKDTFSQLLDIQKETLVVQKGVEAVSVDVETISQEVKEIEKEMMALVSATWRLETGNGSSDLWNTNNNPGGIKCFDSSEMYCSYESEEIGLQALELLLSDYVDEFGYDLEVIRSKYSESDDTELFTQIYYEEMSRLEKENE